MIEETFDAIESSIEDVRKRFYGVTTATVVRLTDPLGLGRVQVRLPSVDATDLMPWARIAVPMAGMDHGTYFIPNLNDEVLVAFEHGDLNVPYILGSLWTVLAPPPCSSPLRQVRMIKTLAGNTIQFEELPPGITIETPSGQKVALTPSGVEISSGSAKVTLGPSTGPPTVEIRSGSQTLTLTPDGVTVEATGTLTLKASGALDLQAGGVCNISAPTVKIN